MVLRERLRAYEERHGALHLGVTAARAEAEKAKTEAADKTDKWAKLKAELKASNPNPSSNSNSNSISNSNSNSSPSRLSSRPSSRQG